jgi:hypothetical protein
MSESILWHDHFLRLCINHAQKSKDPNTRVGALIVDRDRDIVAHGLNEFPRGIADTDGRWNDREEKLRLVVHAECNAICAAAMAGARVLGSTLYLAATDDTGAVWGKHLHRYVTEHEFRYNRRSKDVGERIARCLIGQHGRLRLADLFA